MGGLCMANGAADTYKFGTACNPSAFPLGTAVFGLHDGVDQAGLKVKAAGPLLPGFPYMGTPQPGAVIDASDRLLADHAAANGA
jgi:hypothetical protein